MAALWKLVTGGARSPLKVVEATVAKREHRRAERDTGAMQEELGALRDDVEQKMAQNYEQEERAKTDARTQVRAGRRQIALMRLRDARRHAAQACQLQVVRDTAMELSMKLETMDTMRVLTRTMTGYNQITLPAGLNADTVNETAEQTAERNETLSEVDQALLALSAQMFEASTARLQQTDEENGSLLEDELAEELAAMEHEIQEERNRRADWATLEVRTAAATPTGPSRARGARRARRTTRAVAADKPRDDDDDDDDTGSGGGATPASRATAVAVAVAAATDATATAVPVAQDAVLEYDLVRGTAAVRPAAT